jgi:DHA1 family L-arabinose/isopropyl-beta-D-thiogalactopyranoside export protein-like MFS transporter
MIRLLVLTLGAFVWQTTEILPIGLLPQIAGDLHVSEAQVGLLVTGYAWLVALTAVPLTLLTDRLDRRALVGILLTSLTAANLLAAIAPDYPMLAILRVVVALGHGIFWSIIASLATRLAPDIPKNTATAWAFVGIALALVAGVPLTTAIGQWLGWRSAFVAGALLGSIGVIAATVALPQMPALRLETTNRSVLRQPALLHVSVVTALIIAAHFCGYTYIVPVLERVAGVPGPWLPFHLLIFGIAGLAGNGLAGWLAWSARTMVAIASCGIVASQAAISIDSVTPALAWLDMGLWGSSASLLVVGLQSWVLELAPDHADAASALYVAAFNFGIGSGALVGGSVLHEVDLSAVPCFGAAIGIIAIGVAGLNVRGLNRWSVDKTM